MSLWTAVTVSLSVYKRLTSRGSYALDLQIEIHENPPLVAISFAFDHDKLLIIKSIEHNEEYIQWNR